MFVFDLQEKDGVKKKRSKEGNVMLFLFILVTEMGTGGNGSSIM